MIVQRVEKHLIKQNNSFYSIRINADVNGAYQIMRKVFPKVTAEGIEDVALHPVRVSIV